MDEQPQIPTPETPKETAVDPMLAFKQTLNDMKIPEPAHQLFITAFKARLQGKKANTDTCECMNCKTRRYQAWVEQSQS